jgi:DNA primase
VLHGFDQARADIAAQRRAVVVEGYLDVLTAHQHGFTNVVGLLGTAISDTHVRQLARVADEIVLALDPDSAGQSATWRSLQKAEERLRRGAVSSVGPRRSRETVSDAYRAGQSHRPARDARPRRLHSV